MMTPYYSTMVKCSNLFKITFTSCVKTECMDYALPHINGKDSKIKHLYIYIFRFEHLFHWH